MFSKVAISNHSSISWSICSVFSRALVSLGLFFALADIVSVSEFGVIAYQFTVAFVVGLIVDYGYNLRLSRDLVNSQIAIAKHRVVAALKVKVVLSVVCMLPFLWLHELRWVNGSLFILLFAQAINAFGSTYFPWLRALGDFRREAKLVVLNNAITLSVFFLLIFCGVSGAYSFGLALLFGKILLLCIFVLAEGVRMNDLRIGKVSISQELKGGSSFFLHAIAGYLYINVDTLLLERFVGFDQIGTYQVAMKVLLGACMLTEVFTNVLLPRVMKNGFKEEAILKAYHLKLWAVISCIGVLIGVAYYIGTQMLLPALFGLEYALPESLSLYVAIIVVLRYFGVYPGILLTILNKQFVRAASGIIALVSIVLGTIVLTPLYGIEGAAAASLLAHIIINIIYCLVAYYAAFKATSAACWSG